MLGLTMKLGLVSAGTLFAPHQPPPPPSPAVAVVAPPVTVRDVPVTTGTPTTLPFVAPAPVAPAPTSVTVTATDCTVTWTSTQTNPVNGQSGNYPVTYYGNCDVANQLATEFGGTVTQTAPFTYTMGS